MSFTFEGASSGSPGSPMAGTLPVFDLAATLARFMDNRKLLGRALAAFFARAPQTIARLASSIAADDAIAAREAAHYLKGSASTIGAEQLAALAGSIEQQCLARELTTAGAGLVALQAALERFSERADLEVPQVR